MNEIKEYKAVDDCLALLYSLQQLFLAHLSQLCKRICFNLSVFPFVLKFLLEFSLSIPMTELNSWWPKRIRILSASAYSLNFGRETMKNALNVDYLWAIRSLFNFSRLFLLLIVRDNHLKFISKRAYGTLPLLFPLLSNSLESWRRVVVTSQESGSSLNFHSCR